MKNLKFKLLNLIFHYLVQVKLWVLLKKALYDEKILIIGRVGTHGIV